MRFQSYFNDYRTLGKALRIRGCYMVLSRNSEPSFFHTSKSITQKKKENLRTRKNYEKTAILKFQRIFLLNFSNDTDKKMKGII